MIITMVVGYVLNFIAINTIIIMWYRCIAIILNAVLPIRFTGLRLVAAADKTAPTFFRDICRDAVVSNAASTLLFSKK